MPATMRHFLLLPLSCPNIPLGKFHASNLGTSGRVFRPLPRAPFIGLRSTHHHAQQSCGSGGGRESGATAGKKNKTKKANKNLKRRTRSAFPFDRDLHRRYAQHSGDGGGGHVPVMLGEVLHAFRSQPPRLCSFVDCTLGAGGHSAAIIEEHKELQVYVGLDVDPLAHDMARSRIETLRSSDQERRGMNVHTQVENFKHVKAVLAGIDEDLLTKGVEGILMDLGMSSMQVDCPERGFSVLADGPLDMRMNPKSVLKAEDILNFWPEDEVGRILRDYGDESNWHSLQKKIVESRANGGLHSTFQLVKLVKSSSLGSEGRQGWIKTATRVFQALRIAVNDELRNLEDALYACFDCLSPGGRLAVVSFHSLEDRIVKQTLLKLINKSHGDDRGNGDGHGDGDGNGVEIISCTSYDRSGMLFSQGIRRNEGFILTRRPVTPSAEEEKINIKCRSAKLRVVEKS